MLRTLLRAVLLTAWVASPVQAETGSQTVFAAASLRDALIAIQKTWPREMVVSLGGSGSIARQVDQGAPADVVVLANPNWMDWLDQRGHLRPDTRTAPFGNRLVLAGPPDATPFEVLNIGTLLDRLGENGRLAMGEHRSVPAGQYAKIWLEAKGLWVSLRPRLAEVDNVRAALTLVSRGEVPLALIYASDLVAAPTAASLVWAISDDQQPDIRYSVASLTPAGDDLARHLASAQAIEIFTNFGFTQVEP